MIIRLGEEPKVEGHGWDGSPTLLLLYTCTSTRVHLHKSLFSINHSGGRSFIFYLFYFLSECCGHFVPLHISTLLVNLQEFLLLFFSCIFDFCFSCILFN